MYARNARTRARRSGVELCKVTTSEVVGFISDVVFSTSEIVGFISDVFFSTSEIVGFISDVVFFAL